MWGARASSGGRPLDPVAGRKPCGNCENEKKKGENELPVHNKFFIHLGFTTIALAMQRMSRSCDRLGARLKSELQVDLELVQSKREILIAKPLAFYTIKKLEKINMLQSSDFRSQITIDLRSPCNYFLIQKGPDTD